MRLDPRPRLAELGRGLQFDEFFLLRGESFGTCRGLRLEVRKLFCGGGQIRAQSACVGDDVLGEPGGDLCSGV